MYLRHFQHTFTCQHVNPSGIAAPTPYLKSTYILFPWLPRTDPILLCRSANLFSQIPAAQRTGRCPVKAVSCGVRTASDPDSGKPAGRIISLQKGTSAEVTFNRAYKGEYLANGIYPGCSFY
jgi:hypothetical protein